MLPLVVVSKDDKTELIESDGEVERRRQLTIHLRGVFKDSGARVLIKGEGGSGKTSP